MQMEAFIFPCITCQGFTFILTIHENPKKGRSSYYRNESDYLNKIK